MPTPEQDARARADAPPDESGGLVLVMTVLVLLALVAMLTA